MWNFRTQGLSTVGQDEVVILLIKVEGETLPAKNIFEHLQQLYEQAKNGIHDRLIYTAAAVIDMNCCFQALQSETWATQ